MVDPFLLFPTDIKINTGELHAVTLLRSMWATKLGPVNPH